MDDENLRNVDNPHMASFDSNGERTEPDPDSSLFEVVSDEEIEDVPESVFNGFELARGEYFPQLYKPAITLARGKLGVNTACIKRLPTADYAQVLINQQKKMLAIRPCLETDIFSFQWCSYRRRDNKRQPRQITARLFFLKICKLMDWSIENRYKIQGNLVRANNEYLFLFNLNARQTFLPATTEDGKQAGFSRKAILPAEWQFQFGIPYEEHKKALQINMFDGFAVYSIKGESETAPIHPIQPSLQTPSLQTQDHHGGDRAW